MENVAVPATNFDPPGVIKSMSQGGTAPHPSRPRRRQAGQSMVEYALIISLCAVVVIIVLMATGTQYKLLYSDIITSLRTAGM